MTQVKKGLIWLGDSKKQYSKFPENVQDDAGYDLHLIQIGETPSSWKPMSSVGAGVKELRILDKGQYRIFYLTTRPEGVYVLHAFQKKSQKTAKRDIELGKQRFKELD